MINENSKESEILDHAGSLLNKTLRMIISEIEESSLQGKYYSYREEFSDATLAGREAFSNNQEWHGDYLFQADKGLLTDVERMVNEYQSHRKGLFGNLLEKFGFNLRINNDSGPDFHDAEIELKSTPLLRNAAGVYRSKERLVFSMIDYKTIVEEDWLNSSFLKKNKKLLIIFYLYEQSKNILDYQITHKKFVNLLSDLSSADMLQIKSDWQYIVDKVLSGEAHLLSEAQTSYLSAATKAKSAQDRRKQPFSDIEAKPRAFSFKSSYLNSLFRNIDQEQDSLFSSNRTPQTIEEFFDEKFSPFFGKTENEIAVQLNWDCPKPKPKNHRRMLVTRILGVRGNKVDELTKSNTTLKVIKLEKSGALKESLPFPIFRYTEIVNEDWEDSTLFKQLTENRFVFVIFKERIKDVAPVLENFMFWHFPMRDIREAEKVWRKTVSQINKKKAHELPKISDSYAIHVRPHAQNKNDTFPTPYGKNEVKKSFWLNAKFVESFVSSKDSQYELW